MERYRIEVGHAHGVKPANIVGAIANEAGLDAKYIGHIEIHDDHSVLDLPEGMPKELLHHLKTVWVAGQQLRISHAGGASAEARPASRKIPLSVPKKGAERRVEAKKTGPKPHRKGTGPKS
jgi:ATP-dependent RNA helicase DeaD